MKRVLSMGLLIISAMVLFANGGQDTEQNEIKLTISVMNSFLGDEMPILLNEFNARNPGVKADVVQVTADGWVDYFTKIRTMIAGGEAPDVMYVAIEGAKYVASSGMAIPIDDYMKADAGSQEIIDDLHPKLQSAFEFDGKTWGTVFGWNNVVTHFNMDMLNEVGLELPSADWDKDEFIRYAKALTREVNGQKVFGVSTPGGFFMINAWLYTFGASLLNDDWTESALDSPEALDAFQTLYDLIYKYEVASSYNGTDESINLFTNDQVAMCFLGRWPLPSWAENDMNFDIQYLPKAGNREVIFGSGAFMVGSASESPKEAYMLGQFLSSAWSQKTAIGINTIPTSISVMDKVLPTSAPANTMLYRESADIAKAVPSPEEFPEMASTFLRYYSLMMSNEMPVEDAVDELHDEINKLLGN